MYAPAAQESLQSRHSIMTEAIARAYRDLPYPSQAFPEMHPDRLAVIATLFGMHPARPERCRMLELGCGSGGSLIPFAYTLPESTFLGIDITESSILSAQSSAAKLGLENVEFRCQDILQIPESIGMFDYIAAHGVYSWVPAEVRERILEICQRHLAPHGVAYISYNARPGSDLRNVLRQMMLFHTQAIESPEEQVRQARAVTEFLANAKGGNEIYTRLLDWNRERIARLPDPVLFHDDLGAVNDAFFFYEFTRQAGAHDLQYLGDADLFSMNERRFDAPIREQIAKMDTNLFAAEQYMDFLAGRAFRETLLCHSAIPLDRRITEERIAGMYFACQLEPVSASPRIATDEVEEFRGSKTRVLRTGHRLAKAMIFELTKVYPASLTLADLHQGVGKHLGDLPRETVAAAVLETHASGPALEITFSQPPGARHLSERPRVSPLVRLQIEAGAPTVTTLRCHVLEMIDPLVRALLLLLDGTRDRAALVEEMVAGVLFGRLTLPAENSRDEKHVRKVIEEGLDHNLRMAYRSSILVE